MPLVLWACRKPSAHSVNSPAESDEGKSHEDAGVQVSAWTQQKTAGPASLKCHKWSLGGQPADQGLGTGLEELR